MNQVADYLSHVVLNPEEGQKDHEEEQSLLIFSSPLFTITQNPMTATQNDPVIQEILTYLHGGWPLAYQGIVSQLRTHLSSWKSVCFLERNRAGIPAALKQSVLKMAHEGHLCVV